MTMGQSLPSAPSPGPAVNVFAYGFAVIPLIATALEQALIHHPGLGPKDALQIANLASFFVYIVLAGLDRRVIRTALDKAGRNFTALWVFLPPSYLWRRATCLGLPRTAAWLWCLSFALSIALSAALYP
ncbi:hypothetical protein [Nitrospirillum viridazoti]|uniref:Uncharacterized protein n=1 Tax=Nitrospirillum viridazoti CBAmc TaxID=1441467 RepID=A0A248JMU3_9PROT|nr:hypothetical protein [Nitrospirillum amazonense]ASG19564.1 hypothetical protein Y958_01035 [Nitrospirillum amazonense CBAmc]TWB26614.1 hypothetical protein FBZ91_13921 [Nitrospirillum amazonense]